MSKHQAAPEGTGRPRNPATHPATPITERLAAPPTTLEADGATARAVDGATAPRALLIGLTGGIAAGKSTVAKQLAERGAVIVDSDQLAREVVEPGSPGLAAVAERFGDGILTEDGALNRPALGAIVFRDERARRDLEAITHPRIAELRDRRTREAAEAGASVVVHDVPLLVEKDMAHLFDLVVVVHAPKQERVTRMVRERGMTKEAAHARIAAQATKKQRRAVADLWIDNTGAPEELTAVIDALWDGPIADALAALRNRSR